MSKPNDKALCETTDTLLFDIPKIQAVKLNVRAVPTTSTGTVQTSAKARLISAAIW